MTDSGLNFVMMREIYNKPDRSDTENNGHLVFQSGDVKHWNYKQPIMDNMMTHEKALNSANTLVEAILERMAKAASRKGIKLKLSIINKSPKY